MEFDDELAAAPAEASTPSIAVEEVRPRPLAARPSWEQVRDAVRRDHPDVDLASLEGRYRAAVALGEARDRQAQQAAAVGQPWQWRPQTLPAAQQHPLVSEQVRNLVSQAYQRIQSGNPEAGDADLIARHERDPGVPEENQRELDSLRRVVNAEPEGWGSYLMRRSIPIASAIISYRQSSDADAGARRLRDATPLRHDENPAYWVAREEQRNAQSGQRGFWGQAGDELVGLPAILGEAWLAGGLLRGAVGTAGMARTATSGGLVSRTAQNIASAATNPGSYARNAVMTAAMPSMWLERAAQTNREAGRTAGDIRGFASAGAMGFATTAVLGSLGAVGDSIPGRGFGPSVQRILARTVTGMAEQAGIDIGATAIDRASTAMGGPSLGLDTHWGTVGSLIRRDDDALGHFFRQAIVFGVFSGIHELSPGGGRHEPGRPAEPAPVVEAAARYAESMRRTGEPVEAIANRGVELNNIVTTRIAEGDRVGRPVGRAEILEIAKELEGPDKVYVEALANRLFSERRPPTRSLNERMEEYQSRIEAAIAASRQEAPAAPPERPVAAEAPVVAPTPPVAPEAAPARYASVSTPDIVAVARQLGVKLPLRRGENLRQPAIEAIEKVGGEGLLRALESQSGQNLATSPERPGSPPAAAPAADVAPVVQRPKDAPPARPGAAETRPANPFERMPQDALEKQAKAGVEGAKMEMARLRSWGDSFEANPSRLQAVKTVEKLADELLSQRPTAETAHLHQQAKEVKDAIREAIVEGAAAGHTEAEVRRLIAEGDSGGDGLPKADAATTAPAKPAPTASDPLPAVVPTAEARSRLGSRVDADARVAGGYRSRLDRMRSKSSKASEELAAIRKKFESGLTSSDPAAAVEEVMTAAKLTEKQKHIVRERILRDRSMEDVARDPQMLKEDGTVMTRQGIADAEARAFAKVGIQKSLSKAIHDPMAAEGKTALMERAAGEVNPEAMSPAAATAVRETVRDVMRGEAFDAAPKIANATEAEKAAYHAAAEDQKNALNKEQKKLMKEYRKAMDSLFKEGVPQEEIARVSQKYKEVINNARTRTEGFGESGLDRPTDAPERQATQAAGDIPEATQGRNAGRQADSARTSPEAGPGAEAAAPDVSMHAEESQESRRISPHIESLATKLTAHLPQTPYLYEAESYEALEKIIGARNAHEVMQQMTDAVHESYERSKKGEKLSDTNLPPELAAIEAAYAWVNRSRPSKKAIERAIHDVADAIGPHADPYDMDVREKVEKRLEKEFGDGGLARQAMAMIESGLPHYTRDVLANNVHFAINNIDLSHRAEANGPIQLHADRGGKPSPSAAPAPDSATVRGLSDHHATLHDKAMRDLEASIKAPSRRAEFTEEVNRALHNMTPEVAAMVNEGAKAFRFFGTTAELGLELARVSSSVRKAVEAGKEVGGGYAGKFGMVYLDGRSEGRLAHEIYSHEFFHAVDKDGKYSSDPKLLAAFEKEGRLVGQYASTAAHEFFAEAGRQSNTHGLDPKKTPLTYEFFKENGLLPREKGDGKQMPEVFKEAINDGANHADTLLPQVQMMAESRASEPVPEWKRLLEKLKATGTKHTAGEQQREAARLGKLPEADAAGHRDRELNQQAMDINREDPAKIDALVQRIKKDPNTAISDLEHHMLNVRVREVSSHYDSAARAEIEANNSGSLEAQADAAKNERLWRDAMDEITAVARHAGTQAGRTLRARKVMLLEDFSLAQMLVRREAAKGSPLTAEEKANVAKQSTRIAELEAEIRKLEAEGKAKPGGPSAPDRERVDIVSEIRKTEQELREKRDPFLTKVWRGAKDISSAVTRSLMASIDFPLMRQGQIALLSHPIRTLKSVREMFRATFSEKAAKEAEYDIHHRDNAALYKAAGLDLTSRDGPLTRHEEGFFSRLLNKTPVLGHVTRASERGYQTVMNRIRADAFDAMASTLSTKGQLTMAEAKVIANYVNVMTGRGNISMVQPAAETLAHVFFAPRWAVSRFQYLLGQPIWTNPTGLAAKRARMEVAKEYARFMAGAATVLGLAAAAGLAPQKDPRGTDFGKIKVGNTRLDVTGSLAQTLVFLSRVTSGKKVTMQGRTVPIRGQVPYGGDDTASVVGRFVRGKLAPLPGAALDMLTGRNVVGEPVSPFSGGNGIGGGTVAHLVTPLFINDVYEAWKDLGLPRATATSLFTLMGAGTQTITPRGTPRMSTVR